jgi:hypothetical protein
MDAFPVSPDSSEQLFSLLTTLVIRNQALVSRIVHMAFLKSPDDDALIVANVLFRSATFQEQTIVIDRPVIADQILVDVCSFLTKYFNNHAEISQLSLELAMAFFGLESLTRRLARRIFDLVMAIAKKGVQFEGIKEFRKSAERWMKASKTLIGPKLCGQCSASLQMLTSRDRVELEPMKSLNEFVARKWRSRTKWIDEGLRDETDSDDNFADLEGFIVEESPPITDYEEEEETDSM